MKKMLMILIAAAMVATLGGMGVGTAAAQAGYYEEYAEFSGIIHIDELFESGEEHEQMHINGVGNLSQELQVFINSGLVVESSFAFSPGWRPLPSDWSIPFPDSLPPFWGGGRYTAPDWLHSTRNMPWK